MALTPVTRTQSATKFGYDLSAAGIGTSDYKAVYKNVGVKIDAATADGAATLDTWEYNVPIRRKCTLDFSKVVETTLPLAILAAGTGVFAGTLTHASSGTTIAGNFVMTSTGFDAGGDGPQSETMTAVNQGAITVT